MTRLLMACFLFAGVLNAPGFTKKGATARTSGSQADVQAAIDAAAEGSTVTIPSGTFDWSGQLTIKKAISLAGNGVQETIIRNQNGSSTLIAASSGKGGHIQIYGIKFLQIADNGGGRGFTINAHRDESTLHTVIVHDCAFEQGSIYGYSMRANSNGILVYNCSFVGSGPTGMGGITEECSQSDYGAYNTPSTLGTRDVDGLHNTYIEDCQFYNAGTGCTNFDAGSRTVWRHNYHQDAATNSHGQETSPVGVIAWELYDNVFKITKDNPYLLSYWVYMRGGTGVFCHNQLDEVPWGKNQFVLTVFSIARAANDGHGGVFCSIEYPAPRQTGWSWTNNNANWGKVEDEQNPQLLEGGRSPGYFLPNGKGAIIDPVYVWDNTGPGTQVPGYVATETFQPDNCGNGQTIATYLQKGRDYYVDAGPKPGWTPYPYPHPLRSTSGGGGPSPTPTPEPTATPNPTASPSPSPSATPPPSHKYLIESDSPIYVTPQK